jgi:hypothetical protein
MTTDNDLRWRQVADHFARADELRRNATSVTLRGRANRAKRRHLRERSDAEVLAAIALREEITGESEA